MKSLTIFLFTSLLAFVSHGETMTMDYGSFYSHVKKLDDEDTSALQFAFGFKRVQHDYLCPIKGAFIQTQKKNIPLNVTAENRFTVPSEKALKMAKAVVVVELGEKSNLCDMSVQLETKPAFLKTQYDAGTLEMLLMQYQHFFDKMGGIMSFLMPSADGLKFHFAEQIDDKISSNLVLKNNLVVLDEDSINKGMSLDLPLVPIRITAKLDNEKD